MVRVRFAPSPTGSLHLGNALSAVANRRFADEHAGTLLLRIDDTDAARNVDDGVQAVVGDLEWLGVRWDEYTPDTSQTNDARDTFGVVGVIHFTPWLQAMLEYDHAIDHVHAPGKQETDQQIEIGSGVLQARF